MTVVKRMIKKVTSQSRAMSFVETIANVVVGFLLAILTQVAMLPLFGLQVSVSDNLSIGGIFTLISIARSFALRRLFEGSRRAKEDVVLRDQSQSDGG